ncbi:MAG: short chain dehydrogenase [bacterium ADurb.Bin429]|nr:MAG: short chain dehydrogenase [bacterium ADurb.Bin429]
MLDQLIALSRELGKPEHDLAILGEGNTSVKLDDGAFWVKASGTTLSTADENSFVKLNLTGAVALLDEDLPTDEAIQAAMLGVRAPGQTRQPSVEAMMHAFLLTIPGITFIGHTHPTAVNALLCGNDAEKLVSLCLFPDQIVCCGASPVYVPYTDPGLPLARAVRDRVNVWMQAEGMAPKAILIQNHGIFALGATPKEVMSCSLMWVKTARVIRGALACGGIHPLTEAQVARIATRPDEKFRAALIGK